jgi:hypothetical protein
MEDLLETKPSMAVLVVAPGCPAELVQELLGSGVLPRQDQIDVLLPASDLRAYGQFLDHPGPAGAVRFLPSPSRRFFSPWHLHWLWENLRPSGHNLLLLADSPYQAPLTALLVLMVLALSGKEILLLFATPEAVIDLTGEGFSERWLTQELNVQILVKELGRVFWFLQPLNILYFLMFGGLIVRKKLGEFLAACKDKARLRNA